jgi:hypothetical protein
MVGVILIVEATAEVLLVGGGTLKDLERRLKFRFENCCLDAAVAL